MRQITPEPYPDVTMEEVTHDNEDTVTDRLDQVTEARNHSISPHRRIRVRNVRVACGSHAVVDENGYLIPVCTAYDLLRAYKYFWRASQD
jgi:hypothetical protein